MCEKGLPVPTLLGGDLREEKPGAGTLPDHDAVHAHLDPTHVGDGLEGGENGDLDLALHPIPRVKAAESAGSSNALASATSFTVSARGSDGGDVPDAPAQLSARLQGHEGAPRLAERSGGRWIERRAPAQPCGDCLPRGLEEERVFPVRSA